MGCEERGKAGGEKTTVKGRMGVRYQENIENESLFNVLVRNVFFFYYHELYSVMLLLKLQ